MHIGVDATCWQNNRGYGRHARALLSALVCLDTANRYTFCLDYTADTDTLPSRALTRMVQSSKPTVEAASSHGRRSARDMWQMSRALSSTDFDIVLFPTIYSYVPVVSRAFKIVVIHDVIAEKFPHLTQPDRMGRLFWKTKVTLGRRQADAIATVSDYSRRQLVEQFGLSAERVAVVGEASDPVFHVLENPQPTLRLESVGIKQDTRTILYVGGFAPHKNLERLVEVFARITSREQFSDIRLVMVGEHENEVFHSYFGTIQKQVRTLGISERVIFTGYLPDEDLNVLLNLGTVLVLPSLMEGFGLPAIEAAACGCPVVATTASPLPTILGDGGLYIDSANSNELETALVCILTSDILRRRMSEAGLAAARAQTWDKAARQMMELIGKVGAR